MKENPRFVVRHAEDEFAFRKYKISSSSKEYLYERMFQFLKNYIREVSRIAKESGAPNVVWAWNEKPYLIGDGRKPDGSHAMYTMCARFITVPDVSMDFLFDELGFDGCTTYEEPANKEALEGIVSTLNERMGKYDHSH